MKNHSAAQGARVIPYNPHYRGFCKTTSATILFQQLEYWFSLYPDGFYKFLKPAENAKLYKEGDSWIEELSFSEREFRTAFEAIGIRYTSKTAYNRAGDKFGEGFYCSYYDKVEHVTWYYRNHAVVDKALADLSEKPVREAKPRETAKRHLPTLRNAVSRTCGSQSRYKETETTIPETTGTESSADFTHAPRVVHSRAPFYDDIGEFIGRKITEAEADCIRSRFRQKYTVHSIKLAVRGFSLSEYYHKKHGRDIDLTVICGSDPQFRQFMQIAIENIGRHGLKCDKCKRSLQLDVPFCLNCSDDWSTRFHIVWAEARRQGAA